MSKRAYSQDNDYREHKSDEPLHSKPRSDRHPNNSTGTLENGRRLVSSVSTNTATLESVLTLQHAFIGAHEIAVSAIENSRDDKKFVVEEVDEHWQRVGKNHFFTDIFEAVDFYGKRLKEGALPKQRKAERYQNPEKYNDTAGPVSVGDYGGPNANEKYNKSYDYHVFAKNIVFKGIVEKWNPVARYGLVRDDGSGEEIYFHASHKHRESWVPVHGDVVDYYIKYDNEKNCLSAFDVDVRYTVAPKNTWQHYLDKFENAMGRRGQRRTHYN